MAQALQTQEFFILEVEKSFNLVNFNLNLLNMEYTHEGIRRIFDGAHFPFGEHPSHFHEVLLT